MGMDSFLVVLVEISANAKHSNDATLAPKEKYQEY